MKNAEELPDGQVVQMRQATLEDQTEIWHIIEEAKDMMRCSGRSQWHAGYPLPSHIENDIRSGHAYVLCLKGKPVFYGVIALNGEPEYARLSSGHWLTDGDYIVLHRMAVAESCRGTGLASLFLRQVEMMCRTMNVKSIRIDTQYDNEPMIRLLMKEGFEPCGIVTYPVNGERNVYEKIV